MVSLGRYVFRRGNCTWISPDRCRQVRQPPIAGLILAEHLVNLWMTVNSHYVVWGGFMLGTVLESEHFWGRTEIFVFIGSHYKPIQPQYRIIKHHILQKHFAVDSVFTIFDEPISLKETKTPCCLIHPNYLWHLGDFTSLSWCRIRR